MVEGADEIGLSKNLRLHLADKHLMTELAYLGLDETQRMELKREAVESQPMAEPGEMTGTTGEFGPREKRPDYILCPFCNTEIRGSDAESLSDNLRHHWVDAHQMRPTLMAELGLRR